MVRWWRANEALGVHSSPYQMIKIIFSGSDKKIFINAVQQQQRTHRRVLRSERVFYYVIKVCLPSWNYHLALHSKSCRENASDNVGNSSPNKDLSSSVWLEVFGPLNAVDLISCETTKGREKSVLSLSICRSSSQLWPPVNGGESPLVHFFFLLM